MNPAWKSIDESPPPKDVPWASIDEGPPPPGSPDRRRRLLIAGAEFGLFFVVVLAVALFRSGTKAPEPKAAEVALAPPLPLPAEKPAAPPPPIEPPLPAVATPEPAKAGYGPESIPEDFVLPKVEKPAEPLPAPPAPLPVVAPPEPAKVPKLVFPAAPARSAAAESYLREWEASAHRVAKRDFDAAVSRLRKASRESPDEEVRAEAKRDLEDIFRVGALQGEIVDAFTLLPRGAAVAFEWTDEKGEARRTIGRLVRADRDRAEVRPPEGETVFVEYADIRAPRFLSHHPAKETDDRTAALLLLFEGHPEEAWARLGRRTEGIDPKVWIFARDLREKPPPPDLVARRRDLDARALYYAAEREYRSPRTRAQAAEKYRFLLREFADASLVRRAIERITPRAEAPSELYWSAADARAGGTFRSETRLGMGVVWNSIADSSLPRARENFVEFEFQAEPSKTYRLFVQSGGCCLEVLSCYYQASELTAPHPAKPKTTVAIEPGSIYGLTVKLPAINLKPAHAAHDPNGAKRPEAWGWIEIVLPKFATAGTKKVRIVTDQQGFAVARALLSTTRRTAPDEAAVGALEEARDAELLPPAK